MKGWENMTFQKGLQMHFLAVNKSRKHSCFEIYSYLKDSAFTAVKRNEVCKRGTIFVNRRYTKGSKLVYKRVRGWTSGKSLPV